MESRDLQYFVAVAEHGNLRRAAADIGISQLSLSKTLRRLEKSVGTNEALVPALRHARP